MEFIHELGKKAKDKISGMSGILTARCEFLTGCNRYCVTPQELKDGRPIEGMYFDEAQIEIIGNGIAPHEVQGIENGACSPDATK
jgi:hypothetical protein